MKRAVYAGSFDPITNGHLWMIDRGAQTFDHLTVAIGINPDKKYTFTLEERLEMLKASITAVPKVEVASFENQYLAHYAESIGAQFILRGIRDVRDYEFERGMRNINQDLHPTITTVFLMPPRDMAEVSSSFVKGLVGPTGWETIVRRYVPEPVCKALVRKYG